MQKILLKVHRMTLDFQIFERFQKKYQHSFKQVV